MLCGQRKWVAALLASNLVGRATSNRGRNQILESPSDSESPMRMLFFHTYTCGSHNPQSTFARDKTTAFPVSALPSVVMVRARRPVLDLATACAQRKEIDMGLEQSKVRTIRRSQIRTLETTRRSGEVLDCQAIEQLLDIINSDNAGDDMDNRSA